MQEWIDARLKAGPVGGPPSKSKEQKRRSRKEPAKKVVAIVDSYAVIKTGGKQYRVAAGEKIKVEKIVADVGQELVLDQVLAVGSGGDLKVGAPWVAGATVTATVVAQGKHDKVRIFKMRRRKHYQKHGGHRQTYTELHIGSING
jgi:large subunit ribosomal protein L21